MYFGIPLRSKASSKNWKEVERLFNNTLKSILNQSCPDFKVIVICHDIPELEIEKDDRVEFHQVNIKFPTTLDEQMNDKGFKVHMIGKIIHDLGGGYTMVVDADDLISNRICEFVKDNYGLDGWYIETGYIYYENTKKLSIAPKFPSGSNCIIYYKPSELPPNMDNAWKESEKSSKYIITKGHSLSTKIQACENIGKKLYTLPFRGGIYILGTGENHSTQNGRRSLKRSIMDFFLRRPLSSKIKNEFSI